jgi:hypothetical protein
MSSGTYELSLRYPLYRPIVDFDCLRFDHRRDDDLARYRSLVFFLVEDGLAVKGQHVRTADG